MTDTLPASPTAPVIQTITVADITASLREGVADFRAMPGFGMAIGGVFALGGIVILLLLNNLGTVVGLEGVALAFPTLAGFALVGPFAAMGLYEASRRLDAGRPCTPADLIPVLRATSNGNILFLGFILIFALLVWLRMAALIYALFFGLRGPSFDQLLVAVFTTPDGFMFLLIGNAVGAAFAFLVFAISLISFPFMLDRQTDPVTAIALSVATVTQNFVPLLGWAVFVGVALALAWAPFFLGLVVVLPILGHTTWRLYRRLIVHPDLGPA